MKKIGIVCDNYKLQMFEELLTKGKYIYFLVHGKDVTTISVRCGISEFVRVTGEISAICKEVEDFYKAKKN